MENFKLIIILVFFMTSCEESETINEASSESKTGYTEVYNDSESIKETGLLINGVKSDLWISTDENQNIVRAVHYDEGKILFKLDETDFNFKTVPVGNSEFKINIPISWDVLEDERSLLSCKKKCDSDVLFCPVVSITNDTTSLNIEKYSELLIKQMKLNIPNMRIIIQKSIEINSVPAYRLAFVAKVNDLKLGFHQTILIKEKSIYMITCTALNEEKGEFLKYKGLFDKISESIQ